MTVTTTPAMPSDPNSQMYSEAGMDVDIVDVELDEIDLQDYIGMFAESQRQQARERHLEVQSLVDSLGGNSRKYRRERGRRARAMVSEVYSCSARDSHGQTTAPLRIGARHSIGFNHLRHGRHAGGLWQEMDEIEPNSD